MSEQREVESPCCGVCQIDKARQLCIGCWRTLGEIAQWPYMSCAERVDLIDTLSTRRGHAPDERASDQKP